jgi:hypothetical protein
MQNISSHEKQFFSTSLSWGLSTVITILKQKYIIGPSIFPYVFPSLAVSSFHRCCGQTICKRPLLMFLPFLMTLTNSMDHLKMLSQFWMWCFLVIPVDSLRNLICAVSVHHSCASLRVQLSLSHKSGGSLTTQWNLRNISFINFTEIKTC